MSYTVHIRKNATGETRVYLEAMPWEEQTERMWSEGNYSCDCNRHLLLERAGGRQPELEEGGDGLWGYADRAR